MSRAWSLASPGGSWASRSGSNEGLCQTIGGIVPTCAATNPRQAT